MLPNWYLTTIWFGPIPVHAWGLFVALGFIVATMLAARLAPRHGFRADDVYAFAVWAVVAGFIGARLAHVFFYEPSYFLAHPFEVLAIWRGGLSSFGGFAGAVVAALVFVRRRRVSLRGSPRPKQSRDQQHAFPPSPGSPRPSPGVGARDDTYGRVLLRFSDLLLWPLTLGWFIGRLGCYSIHDHPGIPCTGFLCVPFPDGTRRLDMGLLDGLLALGIFLIVLPFRRRLAARPGATTAIVLVAYGLGRFALDFLRVGDARYAGLTPAQWGSIAMIIGAFIVGTRVRSTMERDPA